ncbi:MAG: DegT/DnrJ/EryC1/StrS family aminotransferase [Desulfovibrio sp.]|jgi:dTDP-4-amino-4,6-dideoxygalactose transaminase|nr:DegT/DnrJ/EryC1/StrS family aminotransferase [Desulfovibrio sp.]
MLESFIPFANPRAAYMERRDKILDAVVRVFDGGRYILGETVGTFEKAFAAYLGLDHAVGCASGTDAIELALRGLGIGRGKAVFTVSHTAVATVAAIERAGAVPVLVDIDEALYTMSPDSLEETILHVRETRPDLAPAAVVPVHIYGHPCDMDAILDIAARYGLSVVEDCAQAHGARYKGKVAGTMGHAAAFSFYPTKNLGALGDAGAVVTNDAALAAELRAQRQYGWKERYISAAPGVNSRMDPVQAAILSVQLRHLDKDNAARRAIAATCSAELAACGLGLPGVAAWAKHVFHLYVVRCKERPKLVCFLKNSGIGTAVHYPQPVHLQPAYRNRLPLAPNGLPATESIMNEIVSLPMFPQIGSIDVKRVCTVLKEYFAAREQ